MSTLWGTRWPGSPISVGEDDLGGGFVVIGGDPPDRVRTPPELGGQEYRVVRAYQRECPCGRQHDAQTFELQGTTMRVSDCPERDEFLWWKPREEPAAPEASSASEFGSPRR